MPPFWNRLLTDARSRKAVEVAERYADGLADEDELSETWRNSVTVNKGAGLSEDGLANGIFWAATAAGFTAGEDADRASWTSASAGGFAASWALPGLAAENQD